MERFLKDKLHGGFRRVKPARSKAMSLIKGKRNKSTENVLRMLMVRSGLRFWRMHEPSVRGSPDFFFPHLKLAVFVDGCFWHYCHRCGHLPRTRSAFWRSKLVGNRLRDSRTNKSLRSQGIKVVRVWEHDLNGRPARQRVIARLHRVITSLEAAPPLSGSQKAPSA